MGQLERADELAVLVYWYLGDHWFGRRMPTDVEEVAALRTAAFNLSREVHAGSEPLALKARDIATAVLELYSPLCGADSYAKLKQASRAYEQARLQR